MLVGLSMAHIITIEVEEGYTEDCSVCPFCNDTSGNYLCGLPDIFPDCDEVNYEEMQVTNN